MKRLLLVSALLPALALAACGPTRTLAPVTLLNGEVPAADGAKTTTKFVLSAPQDVAYGAFLDMGGHMRVAGNWQPYTMTDHTMNLSIAWEATSVNRLSGVTTSVRLTPIQGSGYTQAELTTTGLPDEAAYYLHRSMVSEVNKRF